MIGQTLEHFRLVERIGAGGMGEVYKAHDERLDRDVAIKILPADSFQDPVSRSRLLREARTASKLNHPNICTIHEVGEAEGRAFIAMELVEGRPVSALVADGALPGEEVLRYGLHMADALAHAHKRGVVHRDFKSANVVVTPEGLAKVLDFGLARRVTSEELMEGRTLTQDTLVMPGQVAGTLAYMAPEQLRGQTADERSDVWALGVVLYEMAAGERPFKGDTAFELSSSILNQPPAPLPTTMKGAPPTLLRSVIDRCLEKEPGQRYQKASEVRAALEAVQAGAGLPVWPRLKRAVSRHRMRTAAGALAIVVAAAAAVDVGGVRDRIFGRRVAPLRIVKLAVLPFVNIAGDAEQDYLSDGLTQEMISQLGRLNPSGLNVIARSSVMRYKQGDTPIDQVGRELGVEYVLEGSTRQEGGQVRITAELIKVQDQTQLWTKTYERELSGLLAVQSEVAQSVADALALKLLPEDKSRLASARTVNPEVYDAYLKGMFYVSQNTQESFDKGMKILHHAVEIDPSEPLAYLGVAEGYITLGHGGAELHDAFKRARAAAEQALKLDPNMAEAVGALAHVALYYEWDWEKSDRLFKQALELNPSVAMTHYHYAWYLPLVDRLDEAIEHHKIARDLDPLRPLHTAWLGGLYNYAGRFDEAIVEANKALELNPRFSPSFYVLCAAYLNKNMPEEAIAAAQRMIEVAPQRGNAFLCQALVLAGRREEALEIAAKFEKNTVGFAMVAKAYLDLGDKDSAFEVLEKAHEAHRATLPWISVHWKAGGGFESVYDDPRYRDLLRRMNLPPRAGA